ncbi:sugar-binding transcriptional regulator [Okibacterium endophyticum]
MAHAATRYYIDNRSRIEIAEELGISRFKVARLLELALENGIVTIDIGMPGLVDVDLSIALQQRFALTRAIAVMSPSLKPEVVQESLGRVGAQLLSEIVVDGDVLGVTAGRTLSFMAKHTSSLARCEVVQLAGVAGPVRENGTEIVRRISRVSGGNAYSIFAPLLVRDAETAGALRNDPGIRESFRRFDGVTKAVVAIGSWNPPDSQLYDNARSVGLLDELLASGVQGEVAATLFDREGNEIDTVADRSIAISTEQLRAIPEVVGLAGGTLKVAAVRSAIESGVVTSLVTDVGLARRLLESAPGPEATPHTERIGNAGAGLFNPQAYSTHSEE